jgi:uncharacterized protein YjdB
MQKQNNFFILLAILGLSITVANAQPFSGGTGTVNDPYLISTNADWQVLADAVNGIKTGTGTIYKNYEGKFFLLTTDLTISESMGGSGGNGSYATFNGTFDGGMHTITVQGKSAFARIQNATIKNLKVAGSISTISFFDTKSITLSRYASYYSGGICAYAENSKIENCHNSAPINYNTTRSEVYYIMGGICAYAKNCEIIHCSNNGNIDFSNTDDRFSYNFTGGICGWMNISGNKIEDCYNTGNISAYAYSYISKSTIRNGGICAYAAITDTIRRCYSVADLSATARYSSSSVGHPYIGGICGYQGKIQDCFVANAQISTNADTNIGRIGDGSGTYTNCRASTNVTLNENTVNSTNQNSKDGKGENITSLKNQSWLTTNLGWNFTDIWEIPESSVNNGFPVFKNIQVTGVSLNQTSINVTLGTSPITLIATVLPVNAVNQYVIWHSTNTNVATVSVDGIASFVGAGNATIVARTVEGDFLATCSATVTVACTGISLNKNSTTGVLGSSETLIATVLPANASNRNVIWTSSDNIVATVSNNGKVNFTGPGNAVITAKAEDGDFSAACNVTVTANVIAVTLDETELVRRVGSPALTLIATISPSYATNKNISWTTSNSSVATVYYGVVDFVGEGNADITVTTEDGNKTATCNVIVSNLLAIDNVDANKILLYPVPAKNEFFIKSDRQIEKVEIYLLTGSLLLCENKFAGKIFTANLPQGVYTIKIYTEKGVIVRKFVKE